ncbi:hypothetical protein BDN70DRAFT_930180 [Pholiota conissans]|uniref:Uncharacterized protein n=1 Tax=Pholiota conissans TaxID=109636 RepID=A0A9P5Z5X9_9AGAR|nr:hypothetical protein BDN70DRAFT_930180 [Pholiota conissans]
MFPLPLLNTVPDNLEKMRARTALQYQNAFMKNTLVRALNNIYDAAPRVKSSHPAFASFMGYIEMVCDVASLHIQGDEVFAQSLAQHCKSYRWPTNKSGPAALNALKSLRHTASDWKKDGRSYNAGHIQKSLNGMEAVLLEVVHKQVPKFSGDAVPSTISDDKISELVTENMVWLMTNSDVHILVPFCMTHHDVKTSKHWPPVTEEGVQAMPDLVKEFASHWTFAPFDPITRRGLKPPFC